MDFARKPIQSAGRMAFRIARSRSMSTAPEKITSSSSEDLMRMEQQHSAHNYHPIPMVFSQAKGTFIWDPEGNKYIDFLSAYSAVNQAIIVSCCGCFHGRTLGAISMSCDNDATRGFGPLVPGQLKVDFGDANALEKTFKEHGDRICGFLFEPIQGEAGVILPPDGYLKAVRDLCSRYNILMIADEIQTGIARTGKMLACDWENIRPDVVILGKALGAGVVPVSAVLSDKDVMLCIRPGEHGSTFGGNPLSSAVAIAALEVIVEEGLIERAAALGYEFRSQLVKVQQQFPLIINEVRGRGLLNALDLTSEALSPVSAYDLCLKLKERGILAKPTHDTIIRLAPPLCISHEELSEASKALQDVLEIDLPKMQKQKLNGDAPTPKQACDRCRRVS